MGEGGAVLPGSGRLKRVAESIRMGRDCWCLGKDNTCGSGDGGWATSRGYDHKYIYSHLGYNLKPLDASGDWRSSYANSAARGSATNHARLDKAQRPMRVSDLPRNAASDPSWFAAVDRDGAPFRRVSELPGEPQCANTPSFLASCASPRFGRSSISRRDLSNRQDHGECLHRRLSRPTDAMLLAWNRGFLPLIQTPAARLLEPGRFDGKQGLEKEHVVTRWLANHPGSRVCGYAGGVAHAWRFCSSCFSYSLADLRVPFLYSGDAVFIQALVKGIADHGCICQSLGCPGGNARLSHGGQPHFFPEALGAMHRRPACSICISWPRFHSHRPALVTEVRHSWPRDRKVLVYYHRSIFCGENHLFLAAYYLIPPMMGAFSASIDRSRVCDDTRKLPTLCGQIPGRRWQSTRCSLRRAFTIPISRVFSCLCRRGNRVVSKRFYPSRTYSSHFGGLGASRPCSGPVISLAIQAEANTCRWWMESKTYGLKLATRRPLRTSLDTWPDCEMYDQGSLVNENSCARTA